MQDWFIFLRGLDFGLIFALAIALAITHGTSYAVKMQIAFAVSVSGYVIAPILYSKTDFFYLSAAISDTAPLTFLLFTQAAFSEHQSPSRGALLAGAAYLLAGYSGSYLPLLIELPAGVATILWASSKVIVTAILSYCVFLTLRQWGADLVMTRRFFRSTVTILIACNIAGVVIVETLYGGVDIPLWVEMLNSLLIAAGALLLLGSMIYFGPQELSAPAPSAPSEQELAPVERREVEAIVRAMEGDRLYRDMEMTIRTLSDALAIPEHRLRNHINKNLNYRNFNDFLNFYRVGDATRSLGDPDLARTPILTLAMDAGYRSMTTFNKAFKANHGVTPSEYRQKQLSES